MSSVHIRSRVVGDGSRRFDVRFRRGGRGYRVEHAGSFKTMKEAVARRALVAGWLASGLNPKRELERIARPPAHRRFSDMAASWLESRRDLADSTRTAYLSNQVRIDDRFGRGDPHLLAPADVIDWIGQMQTEGLRPATIALYVRQIRMILDALPENPARHRSIRLPKAIREIPEPPDADEVLIMLAHLNLRYRRAALVIEHTGMRVSEAIAMGKRDIDKEGGRIRVRPEISKTGRGRWIPIQPWIVPVIEPMSGVERTALGNAMRRVSDIHPHLLRHRRATLWHQQGVLAVELARRLGHSRPSISLDIYSSVIPLQEAPPSALLALLSE